MLHYLYPLKKFFIMRITKKTISTSKWKSPTRKVMLWAIPSYITTKNHCVPCNMWKSMQYEKVCSVTLNYCRLIVWNNMVLLVHKESKSTNEFTRFCNELGEFLANLSIVQWLATSWYGQVNSLTYEQLKKYEHFNYLILII